MGQSQRLREMEFELALTSQLESVYGLRVRSEGDPLDRRRAGYTTLQFGYRYPAGVRTRTQVKVGIDGRKRPTYRFEVDLEDSEQVENVASDCEGLALAIQEHLAQSGPDSGLLDSRLLERGLGRREDD